jgi:soluble lytic murein transglycosylase-like protein
MVALTCFRSGAALALLAFATPAHADQVWRWRAEIDAASLRFGIPTRWIERVMRAESGGQMMLNGRPIRSHAGAMGLMQLMPGTWAAMRDAHGLGPDPDHPRDNIMAGTAYLRAMYDRFGYPGLFGAYNAGPARYAAWLQGRSALPAETIAYLRSVSGATIPTAAQRETAAQEQARPVQRVFVVQRGQPNFSSIPSAAAPPSAPADPLFALRHDRD